MKSASQFTPSENPPAPDGFAPRLSGRCACCGEQTRSLFAMGHDARFRGKLMRALAAGDWNNRVDWFVDGECALAVTVTDAIGHVARLINRDWTEMVVAGASRLVRRPLTAPPTTRAVSKPGSTFTPPSSYERIETLMARLDRPMAGQWGFYQPEEESAVPSRVLRTHPEAGIDPHAWRIDLFVPLESGSRDGLTLVGVSARDWRRDSAAQNAS